MNHTPVYPREVVKRALELQATALILVHNHPSGDPTPSRADIEMTQEVKAAAGGLGIVLHDHLVIGNGRHVRSGAKGCSEPLRGAQPLTAACSPTCGSPRSAAWRALSTTASPAARS